MTEEQRMNRVEREGILIYDAGMTVAEAIMYCNRYPQIFGYVEIKETQEELLCFTGR